MKISIPRPCHENCIAAALSLICIFTKVPFIQAQSRQPLSEQTIKPIDHKNGDSEATGTVKGNIFDSKNNEPIVGAVVQINKNNHSVADCMTNWDGNYEVKGLEPGEYTVFAKYPMVKTISKVIKINPHNPTVTINFKMEYHSKIIATREFVTSGRFLINDSSTTNSPHLDTSKKDDK